jgi:Ribonuclease G/E
MKVIQWTAALLVISLLIGCEQEDTTMSRPNHPTAEDVREQAAEAAQTTGDYLRDKKDALVAQTERQLADLEQQWEALRENADEKGEQAKVKYDEMSQAVKLKMDAARVKLAELKASTGDAWQDMKTGLSQAMDDLGDALTRARANFSGNSE